MISALHKKAIYMSLRLVVIITVIGIVYGWITSGELTGRFVFRANFWVGATLLLGGILKFITPTSLLMKKNNLIDHTTYAERFMEERDKNRTKAYELIYTGIGMITITGAIQLIIWFVFLFLET